MLVLLLLYWGGVSVLPIEQCLKGMQRIPLMPGPTPLHRLQGIEDNYDVSMLVKRDDMTGIGVGGNKVRSLEYILGEAVAKGCNKVLVSGPAQSNLCMLAAASCAHIRMPCEIVFNSEKPSVKRGNLLLIDILGTKTHFLGECTERIRNQYVETLAEQYMKQGELPYVIRNGAATGRGALGYVAAAIELATQCVDIAAKCVTLFVPGGNGGVAAGLLYGNALIGKPFRIIVVSVENDSETLLKNISIIINEIEEITGIPMGEQHRRSIEITDEYRGEGWGRNTEESERMVFEFARKEGFFIENIYNSKVLVCMKDWILRKKVNGTACYLHTGGVGSLFAQY